MTGVLNAMVGSPTPVRISVTIGNVTTQYGFNSSAGIGSISPSAYRGNTVLVIASDAGFDFGILITGTLAQSLFSSVVVQATDGSSRSYSSAAATFSAGANTQWTWGSGSNKVWTSTSPSPRTALIY